MNIPWKQKTPLALGLRSFIHLAFVLRGVHSQEFIAVLLSGLLHLCFSEGNSYLNS